MQTPHTSTRKNLWNATKTDLTREFTTKTHALEKKQGQLPEKDLEHKQACTDHFCNFLVRSLQIKASTATQWHLLEFGI